jgi:hypothetical protein
MPAENASVGMPMTTTATPPTTSELIPAADLEIPIAMTTPFGT